MPCLPVCSAAAAVDADYHSAFIPLDTDLRGYHEGQLNVTMELVAC
jgi:hypothetical protein